MRILGVKVSRPAAKDVPIILFAAVLVGLAVSGASLVAGIEMGFRQVLGPTAAGAWGALCNAMGIRVVGGDWRNWVLLIAPIALVCAAAMIL
jgi:hypothetical protein